MAQIAINGERLRGIMLEKGVKPSVASTQAGFAHNYWHSAMRKGECSEIAANMLFMQFGINLMDYRADTEEIPFDEPIEPTEPEQTQTEPEPKTAEQTAPVNIRAEVREAILDAVFQIINLDTVTDAMNRVIYNAVKGAIVRAREGYSNGRNY